jgi:hypothetical protein
MFRLLLTVCPSRAEMSMLGRIEMATQREAEALAEQIAALPAMNKKMLLELWGEICPTPPPESSAKN